jgi:hypothetical protein
VVLENIVIGFRGPFPTLTPAKISTDKNIFPPSYQSIIF